MPQPKISMSARLYRERKGRIPTLRRPSPRYSTGVNAVHEYPLVPPHPEPHLLAQRGRNDAAETQVWPHGRPPESGNE